MADATSRASAFALVIGIGSYEHAGGSVRKLPWAVKDAEEVAQSLTDPANGRFQQVNVTRLLDNEASREEIVTQLSEQLPDRANGAELVVIYFAGHGLLRSGGAAEGYLIPADWDGQPNKLAAQGVAMHDLARWVSRINANAVVLILDCCHAAHVGVRERDASGDTIEREIRFAPGALKQIPELRGKGRYLLVSCDEDQTSLEIDKLQHGLFTYHLLRGMRSEAAADKQGRVGLDVLFAYVQAAVTEDAAREGKRQTPWRSFEGGGDVYLARRKAQVPAGNLPPEYAQLRGRWNDEPRARIIADIENRGQEDEGLLLAALRVLAEEAEPLGTLIVFRSLNHANEKVKRYANKALKDIGWPAISQTARRIAQQGDETQLNTLLEGLNALAAHSEPLQLLEELVDLRLPITQELRAIELANNKRLRLREEEVAELFRKLGSRYKILRALGQGTITAAYLAHDGMLQCDCVVRVLQEPYVGLLDVRARFLELSRWAAGFREGSVVRTLDLMMDMERKIYYVVRDYVDGLTLRDVLADGTRFEPLQSLGILRKLAEALADVQRLQSGQRIRAHGGIKPSNVFLTRDNRVVLGDPSASLSLDRLGTGGKLSYDALYLAPEVFRGDAGPLSDLYSLGCVAYELFCGRPPFVAATPMEVLFMHQHNPPMKPTLRGNGRESIDALVMRLLEKEPARRYASAEEVREAIESIEHELRTPRRDDDAGPPAVRPSPEGPFEPGAGVVGEGTVQLLATGEFEERLAQRSGVNLQSGAFMTLMLEAGEVAAGPSEKASVEAGGMLGRYRIDGRLGSGGVGEVWFAHDPLLDRDVCVKVLRQKYDDSPDSQIRFQREARTIAELHHPGICAIYDVGTTNNGLTYIVMQLIRGGTLGHLVRGRLADERPAARIIAHVARAMAYAHQHGVIHRDLKPDNIILQDGGQPIVVDFGLAINTLEKSETTHEGVVVGTPAFMSPEQAAGKVSQLGPSSDIYSLGATLYAVLTGRPPFSGESVMAILHKIMHEEPQSPRALVPTLSYDLSDICVKALAKDPAHRYASMDAFADDLERFLEGEPTSIQPRGILSSKSLGRWLRRRFGR